MNRFTGAIEMSLQSENWYSALFLAMTLPDICCRLETGVKVKGGTYEAWFDKYLGAAYRSGSGDGSEVVFMTGKDCYALRCVLLHQGDTDFKDHGAWTKRLSNFHFVVASCHMGLIEGILLLDVRKFCRDMISGADAWFDDFVSSDKNALEKLATRLVIHVGDSVVNGVMIGGDVPQLPSGLSNRLTEFFKNGYDSDELVSYLVSTGFPEKFARLRVEEIVKAATNRVADVQIWKSHIDAKAKRKERVDK